MMILALRTWLLGIKSLILHPMRSLLTVLGIFIGTSGVIWLVAIGEGIGLKAQEQIEGLGATNIIVRTIKPPAEQLQGFSGPVAYGITRDDYQILTETVPTISKALQIREIRRQFRFSGRLVDGRLVACTPAYAQFNHLKLERGRFISHADMDELKNFCVLGAGTAERLFPYEDPIGQPIKVEQDTYVVIGVMRERTASAAIGGSLSAQDFRYDVYVPFTTFSNRVGDLVVTMRAGSFQGEIIELSQITLQVAKMEDVLPTADVIKTTMAARHSAEDYAVVVPAELLEQAKTTRRLFMLFMGLIAAISLLVGGIGIMNIMLATVTERTREIGIRRALGAQQTDIAYQFLVETTVLSVVGGLLGVIGGLTCDVRLFPLVDWIRAILLWFIGSEDLPELVRTVSPVIVPISVPAAFGISVFVGVVFGLYPAIRASFMDPIEALRHE